MAFDSDHMNPTISIRMGIRELAEYVHRSGGLSPLTFSDLSGSEGTRMHQRFYRLLTPDEDAYDSAHPDTEETRLETEVGMSGTYEGPDITLQLNGRADAVQITYGNDGSVTARVMEVKTYAGRIDPDAFPGESVHWAQAMLYGYLFAQEHRDITVNRVSLVYLSIESQRIIELDRDVRPEDLKTFFLDTARRYIAWASDVYAYQKRRDQSAKALSFPYPNIRDGQEYFMRQVLATISQKTGTILQAPTGIGKTMSALYPAVKALAHGRIVNAFYLTAKASTRTAAENAMTDLRAAGLIMKSITLFAKESLCLSPDQYCETMLCPFAVGYYDRIHDALRHLMSLPAVHREDLIACAKKFRVCPFELSLDFSLYCDVIICDYNYVFDPRVRLIRYFGEEKAAMRLLLVDEAHNLPDRSRSMFSAELSFRTLRKAEVILSTLSARAGNILKELNAYFSNVTAVLNTDKPGIDQIEEGLIASDVLHTTGFRAIRIRPAGLASRLGRFVFQCRDVLDDLPPGPEKRAVLEFFFQARFYLKVLDEFFDASYVTTYALDNDDTMIRLLCLDASDKLSGFCRNRYPSVFFSATLSPVRYFEQMLSGRDGNWMQSHNLPSPFPPENLLVCLAGNLSTRYRQREETKHPIARMIQSAVSVRHGHYLVFLPSFAYLRMIHAEFMHLISGSDPETRFRVQIQLPNMSEPRRRSYLNQFDKKTPQTLVSFAVLGGIFSEGIDLLGDRLNGVVIIGTGLPGLSPERELMREYYQNMLEAGYEHAYVYPGFNKVQQAAGRVIRSSDDRGFVLLIDDRYTDYAYLEMMPDDWNPVRTDTVEALEEAIRSFYGDDQSDDSMSSR